MSTLNELNKIRKQTPNNDDFAEAIDLYLKRHQTCCQKLENIVSFEDMGDNPYGWYVTGKKCKICGKIIESKIDKS